jgi:glucose/arabinose dehydrogenase
MFSSRLWILFLLLATAAACGGPQSLAQWSSPSLPTVSQQSQAPKSQLKNGVRTEPLTPTPIRITPNDLPQPYASESASKSPDVVSVPENPVLRVPSGFTVSVFAEGLDEPRWLALTPEGNVLVTETYQNRIRLLRDSDGDGVADVRKTFASSENSVNQPLGMAFTNGSFFLANSDAVLRFPYTNQQEQLTGKGQKITDLPGGGYNQHWTRNLIVSPDQQKLYVSVGSKSNANEEPLPRASVQIMNLDGSNRQTFASGLRNPVGLDFHPVTGELYTAVNERDRLGDDLVPDYLTRIRQGEFYGWPYAYLSPDRLDPRHAQNGQSDRPELAAQTRTPDVLFQAHSAALGLQFYDGKTFPEKYRNGAFVAFRGSWNRNQGTGYKIVFVPFDAKGRPQGYYEDFLTGFLLDPSGPTIWGRPVGLLALPDGSLLFTEESNNRIYRIQYQASATR